MKLFNFIYFTVYRIVRKSAPHKNPNRAAVSDIAAALNCFLVPVLFIVLFNIDIWVKIIKLWDPSLAEPSKYNLLSPAAVVLFFVWFFTKRILLYIYSRSIALTDLERYFGLKGEDTSNLKYHNHARFLLVFFMLGGIGSVLLYFWKGLLGLLPIFLFLFLYECWVRYEFQWKKRN